MFWLAFLGLGIGAMLLLCEAIAPFVATLGYDEPTDPAAGPHQEGQNQDEPRQLLLIDI